MESKTAVCGIHQILYTAADGCPQCKLMAKRLKVQLIKTLKLVGSGLVMFGGVVLWMYIIKKGG